jgi:ligand-binding sensor domain-containing protein
MKVKSLILFSFLFFYLFVTPENLCQIKFKHLTLKEGLSQSTVNVIIKDKSGFMWFGTQDGLNKYDGYSFTIYKHNSTDTTSISDNFITCMIIDHNGDSWVGTSNGLNILKRNEEIFYIYLPHGNDLVNLSDKYISALLEDNEGNIWIGTWGSGLYKIENSSGKIIKYVYSADSDFSISGNEVRSIFQDSKNRIWVGTWNGLCLYDKQKNEFLRYFHEPSNNNSLSGNQVTVICEDTSGSLWIGTYENGLNKFDPYKKSFLHFFYNPGNHKSISGNQIVSLAPYNNGLWIGTFDGGLNYYNPEKKSFTRFLFNKNDPTSINDNSILFVYQDKLGTLWAGTFSGGINVYDPKRNQFMHYKNIPGNENSLGEGIIRSIYEDTQDNIWIGMRNGGVAKFDRKLNHFENLFGDKLFDSKSIYSIVEDRNNNLWIGTDGNGIIKYNLRNQQTSFFKHDPNNPNSLSNNFIMTIYEDRSGNIWIGTTGGGLNKYNSRTNTFIRFTDQYDPQRKVGKNVWAIFEDKYGDIWLGTWSMGITKLDLKNYNHKRYMNDKSNSSSLSNNTVFCIMEDKRGNLFLGTWGGGLNMYQRASDDFIHYSDKEGLPNNVVYGILNDENDNLWLSTNYGLSKFNPYTKVCKNYTEEDGLQNNEFNQGAYCLSKSGEMFFGGINGFNRFYPDSIKENENIPAVLITSFKVFDNPIYPGKAAFSLDKIILSYFQNYFSLEFASLDYTNPAENKYAYKLEGFDNEWIYSGKRRFASYTNLDPGEYLFRVKGSNNNGIWNEKGSSLKILITPPFWRTWWFIAISTLLVIMLTYLIYKYRINKLLEIERLKNRLASDLHDDIASNLSSIAMFSQIVHDEGKKTNTVTPMMNQLIEKITSMSQDSVASIRDIIWAIDPKPETIFDLFIRVQDTFITHCRAKGINFTLNIPDKEHLPQQNLAPEERKNIWLLMKEAINNSIKHSCANEISIHAIYKSNNLNIIILDNGKGFDTSLEYKGKGMETIKKRAENLNGEVTMVSSAESGTIINLHLKF